MENENRFGRDSDEAVMAMDRRNFLEQAKAMVAKLFGGQEKIDLVDKERKEFIAKILEEALQ